MSSRRNRWAIVGAVVAPFAAMRRSLFYVVAGMIAAAAPVSAADLTDACHAFASAEVIFIGRVKSAPITRRISNDDKIEKARVTMDAAERDLGEALKIPPQLAGEQHRELAIRAIKARTEFERTRTMYPPPVDLSVTPLLVETPFRGVTTPELFMMNKGQPELDPGRSYLFYASRPMGPLALDVILDERPKELVTAEADVRFLQDMLVNNPGTTVYGSLQFQDPDNQIRPTPLPGVELHVSLDGQQFETSTDAGGTFMLTGLPAGELRIEPALPDDLTLPPQSNGGILKGGCLEIHMRAALNGRIRGRVLLDNGTAFRGFVELVADDPRGRYSHSSPVRTNDRGEFTFMAIPPGAYLAGVNIARQPAPGSPFRPTYFPGTTDRLQATPIVVGRGTEHSGLEWVVSSRLGEGSIEVSLDSHGQPQKEMGVCVTTFDDDNRKGGGYGYERWRDEPLVVPVVEGMRYRFVAHARTTAGFVESELRDFIGTPGRQAITLPVAFVTQQGTGRSCSSPSPDKPFSLPR